VRSVRRCGRDRPGSDRRYGYTGIAKKVWSCYFRCLLSRRGVYASRPGHKHWCAPSGRPQAISPVEKWRCTRLHYHNSSLMQSGARSQYRSCSSPSQDLQRPRQSIGNTRLPRHLRSCSRSHLRSGIRDSQPMKNASSCFDRCCFSTIDEAYRIIQEDFINSSLNTDRW